jgi:hypothetical protein
MIRMRDALPTESHSSTVQGCMMLSEGVREGVAVLCQRVSE